MTIHNVSRLRTILAQEGLLPTASGSGRAAGQVKAWKNYFRIKKNPGQDVDEPERYWKFVDVIASFWRDPQKPSKMSMMVASVKVERFWKDESVFQWEAKVSTHASAQPVEIRDGGRLIRVEDLAGVPTQGTERDFEVAKQKGIAAFEKILAAMKKYAADYEPTWYIQMSPLSDTEIWYQVSTNHIEMAVAIVPPEDLLSTFEKMPIPIPSRILEKMVDNVLVRGIKTYADTRSGSWRID